MTSLYGANSNSQQDMIICAYGVAVVEQVLLDEFFAKLAEDGFLVLWCHGEQGNKLRILQHCS